MKNLFAIILVILLMGMATACSNSGDLGNQMSDHSSKPGDNPLSLSENNSKEPEQSDVIPAMDSEQQELCDKYLKPLLYSNFFSGNYISATLQFDWGEAGIITIYQDLAGGDVWPKLLNDKYQITASEVEELLMRYFPIDEVTIQSLAGSSFDPEADAYTMVERGGGPRDVVVTGSEEENDIIFINYDLYGPGDSDNMVKAASGNLQVKLLENGQFNYIYNEIDFE